MIRSPLALRVICTRSVARRNSAGMRTAWLLPFMNTRLGSTSMGLWGVCTEAWIHPRGAARVQATWYSFITSSPRWLITLTAMLPPSGLANTTEVSLLREAQASALISAFREVFRLL